jgi:hypothetical protein
VDYFFIRKMKRINGNRIEGTGNLESRKHKETEMSKKMTVTKIEKKGKIEKTQASPKIEEEKAKAPVEVKPKSSPKIEEKKDMNPEVKPKSSPAPKKKILTTEEIRKVIPPVGEPIPADLFSRLTLGQRAYWSWQRIIRESKGKVEKKSEKVSSLTLN